MIFSIARFTSVLLGFSLLVACQVPSNSEIAATRPIAPISDRPTTNPILSEVEFEQLPTAIAGRVKAKLQREIGDASLQIGRYSRETWTDGCLGLGGPAESCLAALTEGWQVEVIDTTTNKSYFYRTTLNGDSIRRSTLSHNLPPSLRDRIFQTAASSGFANSDELYVITAEPRLWNGCYGIPPEDGVCTEVGILGWRVEIGDDRQSWVYHTDNLGSEIRLNETGEDKETPRSF
ncbi:hypothetical protein IQ235_00105 [Oscillatoriales cyanobacterium LEGE 11467]|uniref:Lipoprotein n=1 Tax=Zarconia navalis LEGE 11467 TaxID=1828826 RepID=A0A928VUZ2_9CYAN|nr:hypothetical protein [Zarconia navalis]MBE9039197.1 hypothetical protein [Zarconia navalis LEGE 11467]